MLGKGPDRCVEHASLGGRRVGGLGLGVRSSSTEGCDCSLFVDHAGMLRKYYMVGSVGDVAFFVAFFVAL